MKPNMKKKFDFSAEMNEAESIKATPKNEYLEEEKRLLKENIKELASLNDNVHYIITNLVNLIVGKYMLCYLQISVNQICGNCFVQMVILIQ